MLSIILIHWKGIYPVEFAIEQLNNWGQNCNVNVTDKRTRGLSSLTATSVFTRERSVQFLTQLCVKKKPKKKKKTLARQHMTSPLPAAIGPFMSLLLSFHPMYD